MDRRTIELLNKYDIDPNSIDDIKTQLLAAYLLLLDATDGFDNKNNTLLYNSCGEIKAADETHYQIQMMLIPERKFWIPSSGVYYSTPIDENPNVN